jgi:CHAD domain-containing protein
VATASSTVPDPTTRLLRQRIRTVFRHLPKGLAGDEESVHQLRVSGRRLRIALPLLAKKPEGRRVARVLRVLRRITRAAGTSRDLDVAVALLEEHLGRLGPSTAERARLRRDLRAARARSRHRMAEALMDIEIARLRRDLRGVVRLRAENLFTVLARLRQSRDERGEHLLAAFAALGPRFRADALHRLRIESRKLRYTAEVQDALKERASPAVELLRDLQERLGRVHDAHLLASWLGTLAARAAARGDGSLAAEARARASRVLASARDHHRELLACNPAAVLEQALEAMGRSRSAA